MRHVRLLSAAVLLLGATAQPVYAAEIEWNESSVRWHEFEEGMARARESGRPAVVVFYASWCATCHAFAELFSREAVAQAADDVVMVRVDIDVRGDLNTRLAPDGGYVPRVVPVSPEGTILASAAQARGARAYRYFFAPSEQERFVDFLSELAARDGAKRSTGQGAG